MKVYLVDVDGYRVGVFSSLDEAKSAMVKYMFKLNTHPNIGEPYRLKGMEDITEVTEFVVDMVYEESA